MLPAKRVDLRPGGQPGDAVAAGEGADVGHARVMPADQDRQGVQSSYQHGYRAMRLLRAVRYWQHYQVATQTGGCATLPGCDPGGWLLPQQASA
eukprot:1339900-Rhodomonas_salina.3